MTAQHPGIRGRAMKWAAANSVADTALSSVVTVPAANYGVVYRLWVSCDVGSEADLENLVATATVAVSIGSLAWGLEIHPFVEHTDAGPDVHRHVDLGPWSFDYGEGLYSGVVGQDITIVVDALGTGIVSRVNYLYSGD